MTLKCKHLWSQDLRLDFRVCLHCGAAGPEIDQPPASRIQQLENPDIHVVFNHVSGWGANHYEWGIYHKRALHAAGTSPARMVAELEYRNALDALMQKIYNEANLQTYLDDMAQNQEAG